MADEPNWVSAHELGDFEYCPRSWWYERHPETVPRTASSAPPLRAWTHGMKVHKRIESSHIEVQQGSALGYATIAALSVALAALMLWWLFP